MARWVTGDVNDDVHVEEGPEAAVEAGVGDLFPELEHLVLGDAVAGLWPPAVQRVKQLAGKVRLVGRFFVSGGRCRRRLVLVIVC